MPVRKYKRRKPLPTKEWTELQIDKYYSKRKVKDVILNIPIDYSRDKGMTTKELEDIYKKYNINYYANKQQFKNSFMVEKEYNEYGKKVVKKIQEIPDSMIDEMWNAYRYRDALIHTGQYQEYRTSAFKENYIKSLRALGTPERVLNALHAIPLKQWDMVASIPNGDKSSLSSTKLPHLGRFAYSTKGGDERDPTADEIWRDVLNVFGIDVDEMQNKIDSDEIEKQRIQLEIEYEEAWYKTKKVMKPVIRIIPKERRKEINDETIDDYEESILSLVSPYTKSNKKRVKMSKKGHFYIPFVGSQSPKSANRQLVSNIVNEFRGRGLSYSDFVEGWDDMSGK